MKDARLSQPFPLAQMLYCSFCGRRCKPLGHIMTTFLLCPVHGEFTIAPLVVRREEGWFIEFATEQEMMMWQTCEYLDGKRK